MILGFQVGFPWDRTSRKKSPDNPGRDLPVSLCPGTKNNILSRCPFVPWQEQQQKSQDKLLCGRPGTKPLPDWQKKCEELSKKNSKSLILLLFFPLAFPRYSWTGQALKIPSWPIPWQKSKSCPGPSFHGKILACLLSWDNEGTSAPLSDWTRKSRWNTYLVSSELCLIVAISLGNVQPNQF